MSLVFVFLDGVGLGKERSENPFAEYRFETFEKMAGGVPFTENAKAVQNGETFFSPIDACLGVEGLPQSGTGQVTLFSGINAARSLGRHFGPYPHSKIKQYLEEHSIFRKFMGKQGSAYFMNAFPDIFFQYSEKRNRWSSTTYMTRSAGLRLNTIAEIHRGEAITAEITQDVWRSRLSLNVPVITEEQAASRVVNAAGKYDLVLMEYYLTDKAGHGRDKKGARDILSKLDQFLSHLLNLAVKNGHTILITSDHGNIEDLSIKTHTRNKVPFYVSGEGSQHFHGIRSIQDVTPMSLAWYESALGQS
ncbi:alkaline phosphatase family protein [Balneolales bacterium ANBcel1]|nr:alkaline phosphatase family protein [Balneolales bacterium ANBcel1]